MVGTGGPSWLVTVAAEADRLEAELDAAVSVAQGSVFPGSASPADGLAGLSEEPDTQTRAQAETAIRSAITQARQIVANYRGLSIRDWWFGTSIESAWQALHLAREHLVVVQSDADLRAQVPRLESMARAAFDSQRSSAERQELGTWLSPPPTDPDRRVARRIMNAYHIVSDARRQQIRGLRNLLYLIAAVLVAMDCTLWATGLTTGSVVGLGAMGGALSAVFVILGGRLDGPYNPLPAQVLLKVAAGATTAVLAVEILNFVTGPSVASLPASSARDNVCAIFFGFFTSFHAPSRSAGISAVNGRQGWIG